MTGKKTGFRNCYIGNNGTYYASSVPAVDDINGRKISKFIFGIASIYGILRYSKRGTPFGSNSSKHNISFYLLYYFKSNAKRPHQQILHGPSTLGKTLINVVTDEKTRRNSGLFYFQIDNTYQYVYYKIVRGKILCR